MARIVWLALLLVASFQLHAKCDFQYLTHNGYGYVCDRESEAADMIQSLPNGNQAKCESHVGGPPNNVFYIRTDIEHRAPPAGSSNGGLYAKQYYCFRKDQNKQFDIYYHQVQYRGPGPGTEPGWISGSRNNDSCQAGGNGSNPIHSASGRKFQNEVDMQLGANLSFERRYNSASLATLPHGNGWTSNFTLSLQRVKLSSAGATTEILANRPNGDVIRFNVIPDEPQSKSLGSQLSLKRIKDASGTQTGWLLYVGGSRIESYDLQGQWRSLTVDGVAVVTAERDEMGGIARLVDHAGRSITLAYSTKGLVSSITDSAQHRVDYTYDSAGRLSAVVYGAGSATPATRTYLYEDTRFPNALTGIIDESGNRFASWAYDDRQRGISSSHGGLSSPIDLTRLQFNTDGSTTITNPLGGENTYRFSFNEGVVQLAGVDERWPMCGIEAQSKTYDANGYPDVVQGFRGEQTDSDYNARGLLTRQSVASSDGTVLRTEETEWHPVFPLPVQTRTFSAQGDLVAASSTDYDAMGRVELQRAIDPATGSHRDTAFDYCDAAGVAAGTCPVEGQLIRTTGPRTDVAQMWSNVYYAADDAGCATSGGTCAFRKGDLWKAVDPLGQTVENLAYDGAGRIAAQKDANGVLTRFEYSARGWLTAVRVEAEDGTDARVTRMEHWPTGLVKRVTQPDGAYVDYRYDAAHRLVETADSAGNTIEYVLDNAGNRVAENTRDASGALTRTFSRVYNTLGELVTQADASANPTDYGYDRSGNLASVSTPLGTITSHEYDALNRLKRTVQDVGGIGAETGFQYDPEDNLTQVTDPKGLDTTYAYNGFGDAIGQQSPDTGVESYTLDAAGNRKTRTDARGVTATYQYDVLNRLTHISYPDPTLDVVYIYDVAPAACDADERFARGRVGHVIHAAGSTDYCYDRFGQVTRKVQTVNGVSTAVRYAYNKAGSLARLTYPDGSIADYVHDSLGRTSEVGLTRPGQARQVVVTDVNYAPFGPITGWTYGNGRRLERPVDTDYRPLKVYDAAPGGLSLTFGYDPEGNIVELKDGLGASSLAKYEYDALGRLTQTQDGPTGTPIETYRYDATGNRTSLTTNRETKVYTYPAGSHHLTAVGEDARSYDAAGNTLSMDGREFDYSDANRMTAVKREGVVTEEFVYNHRGERVERMPAAANSLHKLYNETGRALGNYTSTGEALQQVIWLDGQPIAAIGAGGAGHAELIFIEPDHVGSPRVVVDSVRNVPIWEWSSQGEAFGNQAPDADPDGDGIDFHFSMRFPGQQSTESSGLAYNTHRDYDPSSGRYVQSDAIGLSGGITTYGYVSGNPLSNSDPLGLADRQLGDHKTGRWIDCGKGCRIRIDFNLDMKTGQLVRHLHWECRDGREGECGENGEKSHGGSWEDAPRHIRDCALKNGFSGAPSPLPAPPPPRFDGLEQTPGAKAATTGGALILLGALLLWAVGG